METEGSMKTKPNGRTIFLKIRNLPDIKRKQDTRIMKCMRNNRKMKEDFVLHNKHVFNVLIIKYGEQPFFIITKY